MEQQSGEFAPFHRVTTYVWSHAAPGFIEDPLTQAGFYDVDGDEDGEGRRPAVRLFGWELLSSFEAHGVCTECSDGATPLLYRESIAYGRFPRVCIERKFEYGFRPGDFSGSFVKRFHCIPKLHPGPFVYISVRQLIRTPSRELLVTL